MVLVPSVCVWHRSVFSRSVRLSVAWQARTFTLWQLIDDENATAAAEGAILARLERCPDEASHWNMHESCYELLPLHQWLMAGMRPASEMARCRCELLRRPDTATAVSRCANGFEVFKALLSAFPAGARQGHTWCTPTPCTSH